MNSRLMSYQAIIGVIVVVIGAVFLLETTGLAETRGFYRWIPSLFILLGLWRLVAGGFRNVFGPLLVIAVALFVQLTLLNLEIGSLWPIILIIVGFAILAGGLRFRRQERQGDSADRVNAIGVFGGPQIRVVSASFKGGQIAAFMGGVQLDLRDATVAERPATIDATIMFGGADIKVPADWVVRNEALVLFGGTDDQRRREEVAAEGPPNLLIKGMVLFGGMSIKD